MSNGSGVFLTIICSAFFILFSFNHILRSQSLNEIPLEAFEGFKKDSFTLPGDSFPQPVYRYGVYESKVTTHLQGVGRVYVHHVLYFQEEEYSYMEVYSRKPSSGFIEGIKRYGSFRMYEHRSFGGDTNYTGKPRVEFVHGLDSVIKTIYPLSIFRITSGVEMEIPKDWTLNNSVSFHVTDCIKYVDPILFDSLYRDNYGEECTFSGWIQFDLEADLLKVDLNCGVGQEFILGTFESVIFDVKGNLVGHISAPGSLSLVSLTDNRRYVYTNCGGIVTEDHIASYVFRIFDLQKNEIIFSRTSTTNALSGFAIANSNLGVYKVSKEPGTAYSELETYIIDHDKGIMYLLHMHSLCQPPISTSFFPAYCECYTKDGLKSKIFYKDLVFSIRFK